MALTLRRFLIGTSIALLIPATVGGAQAQAAPSGASASVDVVTPDVDVVVTKVSSCTGVAYAPIGGRFGPIGKSPCGLLGYPGYVAYYRWSVQSGTSIRVCTQGRGYANGVAQWYDTGCGTSGGGYVPWGNNAAPKQMHVLSQNIVVGGFVTFD